MKSVLAHPVARLMLGSLALLFLFIICGGGAASVQPWLANASPSSSAYFSAGTVSIGVISCGSTLSGGMFSIGMISVGTFSVGVFSVGLFSIGFFSIGLASVGHYALGMWAWGIIVTYSKDGQGLELARRLPSLLGKTDEEAPENWLAAGDDPEVGLGRRSAVEVSNSAAPAKIDPKAAKQGKRIIEVKDQRRDEAKKDAKPAAARESRQASMPSKASTDPAVASTRPPPDIFLAAKDGSDARLEAFRATYGDDAAKLVESICRRHSMVDPDMHPTKPYIFTTEDTWRPLHPSRDPEGERAVEQLASILRSKGANFEDPHFPAEQSALFADPAAASDNSSVQQTFRKDQDPFLAGVSGIQWKRPQDFGDENQKVVAWSGGIDPDDVAQGRLGNCYFLAAIASCALGSSDVLVKDLLIEQYADVGMYGVKFFLQVYSACVPIRFHL